MRALQKIVTRGNASGVSIPRPMMIHLGWLPGEMVVIEMLEDKSIRVRRPVLQDMAPQGAPRLMYDHAKTGTE